MPAQRRGREGRAPLGRHRPHGVECVLHGHRHAAGAEQGADQADRQGQAGAVQRADAALDLWSDHRVRAERGAEKLLPQSMVVADRDVKQRDQHEQQRKDRHERVVRDQRGQVTRPVVGELLPHGHAERQHRPAALEPVGAVEQVVK